MTTDRNSKMALSKLRVCLVGAGPSGMSVMWHLNKLEQAGRQVPKLTCYEKQSDWGGLWNYSWRTGTDSIGEPVHGSMYRYLWSNGPKEALEFPDYTFEKHYGRAIPSFPPREVLFSYLRGRWNSCGDLKEKYKINFNKVVRDVKYDNDSKEFTVRVKDGLKNEMGEKQNFDYVIVASGHYSVPHIPSFPGIEKFPGMIMHAHDFRDASAYKGQNVLLVGASYSAEDIALQLIKYGAKHVTCTWRSKPMGFNWPDTVGERPLLQRLEGKTGHFKDGSTEDFDTIIMCTGYLHSYPFLEDNLRLRSPNCLYPQNLYKGLVWLGPNGDGNDCGDNKMLYVGAQDQYYTYTMFDTQAAWTWKYILGDIKLPDKTTMSADWRKWFARNQSLKDGDEEITFQGDCVRDWAKESDYGHEVTIDDILHGWKGDKYRDIMTYRDQSYASIFTGTQSPIHHSNFMDALDDSLECFMGDKK